MLALGRRLNFQPATLFLRSQPLFFADAGKGGFRVTRRRLILLVASALVFRLAPRRFFVELHPLAFAFASFFLAQALALHLMAQALEFLFLRFVAQPDEARRTRLVDRQCRRRLDRRAGAPVSHGASR